MVGGGGPWTRIINKRITFTVSLGATDLKHERVCLNRLFSISLEISMVRWMCNAIVKDSPRVELRDLHVLLN